MSRPQRSSSAVARIALAADTRTASADCWNRIGVRGDSSCPELPQHVHCRNCPIYAAAAVKLLDREPPADYLGHWTQQVAQKNAEAGIDRHSVVMFRVGADWLALRTGVLREVVSVRTIHSIPHRRNGVVSGLANIRGELLVCVSLELLLSLEQAPEPQRETQRALARRFLVIESDGNCAVCPVEEVHGIAHFHPGEVTPVPTTIAKATAYTRSVLSRQGQSVGLLDDQLLFRAIDRHLA